MTVRRDACPLDVTPVDGTPVDGARADDGTPTDEVLRAARSAPRWARWITHSVRRGVRPGRAWTWGVVAIAVVVVVAVLTQPGRHTATPAPATVVPTPAPSTTTSADSRVTTLSDVAGDRCPSGVSCGITATVTPAMSAALRSDFAGATIGLQASAFDASRLTTIYWQQIEAKTRSGVAVVVSEQRTAAAAVRPAAVSGTAQDEFRTVTARRGHWQLTVALISAVPGVALPVSAAEHWVSTVPIPR